MKQTQTTTDSKEVLHTQGEWNVSHSPVTKKSPLSLRWFKSVKNKRTIGGKIIANAWGDTKEEAEANAELIVKAVNNYQKLLDSNRELQKKIDILYDALVTVKVGSVGETVIREINKALNKVTK